MVQRFIRKGQQRHGGDGHPDVKYGFLFNEPPVQEREVPPLQAVYEYVRGNDARYIPCNHLAGKMAAVPEMIRTEDFNLLLKRYEAEPAGLPTADVKAELLPVLDQMPQVNSQITPQ